MGMFEMTPERVVEWRQKFRDLVAPHVNGEDVLAAGAFRRGGAAATKVASKFQLGAVVYAAISLFNKKKAGGRYWYYWLIIVGGILFVIAYYATDSFGI